MDIEWNMQCFLYDLKQIDMSNVYIDNIIANDFLPFKL